MIKFTHTADIHFGVENYGKLDMKTGINTRLLDFYNAFNFCIDKSIEDKDDFFLFSGDAYKTANPNPTQQRLLFKSLLRLQQAGIPVVIIVGNHDNPLSFGKVNALGLFEDLPLEGFYVITKPKILKLETKNGEVQIVGIPWPTKNTITITNKDLSSSDISQYISNAVSNIIKDLASKLDKNIPSILAAHLTVSNGIFSGSEKRAIYSQDPIFLPSQLAISPFDYVALGHLHRYQNLNPGSYPPIIYSGSIERIDFGERREEKGFCKVFILRKGEVKYDFLKVPTRKFVQIEVDIDSKVDYTHQIIDQIKKHDIRGAVVKILYHLYEDQKDKINLPMIERFCSEAMYIVGIIPVRKYEVRNIRAVVKVDMDIVTLLNKYFDTKKDISLKREDLINKVLELEEELNKEDN